jgi:hypothetical protein
MGREHFMDWLSINWQSAVAWALAVSGWASVLVTWRAANRRMHPFLHFKMWAVIEPANQHPREMLRYSFRNSGQAPVHIVAIEGDNDFTMKEFFDPVTIHVDPEPTEGEAPAPYRNLQFFEKHPTRIFAVDSTNKKWPLPKKELAKVYDVFEVFRQSGEAKAGPCTCCNAPATPATKNP